MKQTTFLYAAILASLLLGGPGSSPVAAVDIGSDKCHIQLETTKPFVCLKEKYKITATLKGKTGGKTGGNCKIVIKENGKEIARGAAPMVMVTRQHGTSGDRKYTAVAVGKDCDCEPADPVTVGVGEGSHCKEKDFAKDARKLLGQVRKIKKTWDPLGLIPAPKIDLSNITARGMLCECCSDPKKTLIRAKVSGPIKFSVNKDEKEVKSGKHKNRKSIDINTKFFRFRIGKITIGANFTLDASADVSGVLKKDCKGQLCIDVSAKSIDGTITASPGIKATGIKLTLKGKLANFIPKFIRKFTGTTIGLHDLAFTPEKITGGVEGYFSLNTCDGSAFKGDICAKAIEWTAKEWSYEIPAKIVIHIPILGNRSINLESIQEDAEKATGQKINLVGQEVVIVKHQTFTLWKGNCK